VEVAERDIFRRPLSLAEIRELASMSTAQEMFSWNSPSAKPYRERRGSMTDEELVELMARKPRLIRRTILVRGGRPVFGYRPNEYA
jgi:arsenate reductase-like glutaredoxin family protein